MKTFPGKTWISSHVFGSGVCNHHRKLFYVNIPKCASMWMRYYLSLLGDTVENTWIECSFTDIDIENYRLIILLRDPIKRWVSNCPAQDTILEIKDDIKSLEYVFEDFADWMKDEHSSPQTDFISGLDIDSAIFFYCDDRLTENVSHYLQNQGFNIDPPAPANQGSQNFNKQKMAWKDILCTPKYFKIFKKHFKKDYDLIDSVNFYDCKKIAAGTR